MNIPLFSLSCFHHIPITPDSWWLNFYTPWEGEKVNKHLHPSDFLRPLYYFMDERGKSILFPTILASCAEPRLARVGLTWLVAKIFLLVGLQ